MQRHVLVLTSRNLVQTAADDDNVKYTSTYNTLLLCGVKVQTQENGEKPNFGPDLDMLGPNLI